MMSNASEKSLPIETAPQQRVQFDRRACSTSPIKYKTHNTPSLRRDIVNNASFWWNLTYFPLFFSLVCFVPYAHFFLLILHLIWFSTWFYVSFRLLALVTLHRVITWFLHYRQSTHIQTHTLFADWTRFIYFFVIFGNEDIFKRYMIVFMQINFMRIKVLLLLCSMFSTLSKFVCIWWLRLVPSGARCLAEYFLIENDGSTMTRHYHSKWHNTIALVGCRGDGVGQI